MNIFEEVINELEEYINISYDNISPPGVHPRLDRDRELELELIKTARDAIIRVRAESLNDTIWQCDAASRKPNAILLLDDRGDNV